MSIFKNAYDPEPTFSGATVRKWSHDYGGPEGLAQFATVWDADQNAFVDVCVNSGDNLWGGEAFEDATPEIMAKWDALPESVRVPVPPTTQPHGGVLVPRRYGS